MEDGLGRWSRASLLAYPWSHLGMGGFFSRQDESLWGWLGPRYRPIRGMILIAMAGGVWWNVYMNKVISWYLCKVYLCTSAHHGHLSCSHILKALSLNIEKLLILKGALRNVRQIFAKEGIFLIFNTLQSRIVDNHLCFINNLAFFLIIIDWLFFIAKAVDCRSGFVGSPWLCELLCCCLIYFKYIVQSSSTKMTMI